MGAVVDNFRDWLCLFIWADLEKGVFRGRVISWGKVFPRMGNEREGESKFKRRIQSSRSWSIR